MKNCRIGKRYKLELVETDEDYCYGCFFNHWDRACPSDAGFLDHCRPNEIWKLVPKKD